MAWRCYVASSGKVRFLMRLIRMAASVALSNNREKIDLETCGFTYNRWLASKRRGIPNPFENEKELPDYVEPKLPLQSTSPETRQLRATRGGTNNRSRARMEKQPTISDVINA